MSDKNLTDAGIEAVFREGQAAFDYMAVGTGTQVFDGTLNALVTELDRVATSITISNKTMLVEAFYSNDQANGTITEVGNFDASSSGNMLSYDPTVSRTKDSSDGLIVSLLITGSND